VELSSIKKDLYRRDFTINTLAVRLNRDRYGELIDFFGGLRDIKERTLRILHNLSFVEDPTRVFRAIRFEQRFDFLISKHTQNLIRSAVNLKLFNKLSENGSTTSWSSCSPSWTLSRSSDAWKSLIC